MPNVTIFIAFIAGLGSFLSPCILPLVPAFLTYLAGASWKEVEKGEKAAKLKIFINSVFFVLGFSLVFSVLGILLNHFLIGLANGLSVWLGRIGGVVIIFFGIYLLGLLPVQFLQIEHKFDAGKFKLSYMTSFIFGAAFAVGWTPCIGAVLGGILTLAVVQPGNAFFLLFAYTLGLGMPFLVAGIFTSQMAGFIKKYAAHFRYVSMIMGVLMVILGILVFTGNLSRIASFGFVNYLV